LSAKCRRNVRSVDPARSAISATLCSRTRARRRVRALPARACPSCPAPNAPYAESY
jgi:hypothetical protein